MHLNGRKLDLLARSDECAAILGNPKHAAHRFTHLTPGERGVIVALCEHFEGLIAELKAEISALKHAKDSA